MNVMMSVSSGKMFPHLILLFSIMTQVFGHADFLAPVYMDSYREIHSLFRQTLQGPSLTQLTQSILNNLEAVLGQNLPMGADWVEEGLQSFSNRIMFETGFLTLFGQKADKLGKEDNKDAQADPCMQQVARDFLVFDRAFPEMAAGLPIHLCVRAWLAREALAKIFYHAELQQHHCISALIKRRMDAFDRMQLDEHEKARTHVCMLWASQANTLPTAFWSLYYMLRCYVYIYWCSHLCDT